MTLLQHRAGYGVMKAKIKRVIMAKNVWIYRRDSYNGISH
jgi:hypothetical protein